MHFYMMLFHFFRQTHLTLHNDAFSFLALVTKVVFYVRPGVHFGCTIFHIVSAVVCFHVRRRCHLILAQVSSSLLPSTAVVSRVVP